MLLELAAGLPPIDTDELDAIAAEGQARRRFWEAHYAEYLQRYPEQFVAVKDGEVVATSTHLLDLISALQDQGLNPSDTWFRFISADPYRFLH